MEADDIGVQIHDFAKQLWPLNRSITGDGLRESLELVREKLPELQIVEVPSGTEVFDWTVPKEWRVTSAWIETPDGDRICDFEENNLHLVGYSCPVACKLPLQELENHLHSLPSQPEAIPYVTSYYRESWGFCLSEMQRKSLQSGEYKVHVDAELFNGAMSYGELVIPGRLKEEVFLSTYLCHPSLANNELSGPCVTTFLALWLNQLADRKYTYRIIFIPETIGSITYLNRNLAHLKANVYAGFNITCIGDDRTYSYLPSRNANTISDRIAKHVLSQIDPNYTAYTWRDRGSDERQYCAPHIDLPIASIMRSKYAEYPEYHTSLDDLEKVVTPNGLKGGYLALKRALQLLEKNCYPKMTVFGEPQLGKRGLYPTTSTKHSWEQVQLMMDLITWSDGTRSLLDIAEICEVPITSLYPLLNSLKENGLVTVSDTMIATPLEI